MQPNYNILLRIKRKTHSVLLCDNDSQGYMGDTPSLLLNDGRKIKIRIYRSRYGFFFFLKKDIYSQRHPIFDTTHTSFEGKTLGFYVGRYNVHNKSIYVTSRFKLDFEILCKKNRLDNKQKHTNPDENNVIRTPA